MTSVHPTAFISPQARVGAGFSAGPFAIVEADVVIGDNCSLGGHAVVKSGTTIGHGNRIYEGAVLGGAAQHLSLGEQMGCLRIGHGNVFRENVTVHRGWKPDGKTAVGSRNMVMVNTHIAHDCRIGDETIIANNVMLGGHVELGDKVYVAGAVGVHQFTRVGRNVMLGGMARLKRDVPPFMMLDGDSTAVVGLNVVGLRRSGFSGEEIAQLKRAYRIIYRRQLPLAEILESLEAAFAEGPAAELAPFIRQSTRGIAAARAKPSRRGAAETPAAETPGDEQPMTIRFPGKEAA